MNCIIVEVPGRPDYGQFLDILQVLWPRDKEQPWAAHVFDIAILPEFQNQGLGRMLMNDIILRCCGKGLETLLSLSLKSNMGSIEFHRRMGFSMQFETEGSVVRELLLS